MAATSAGSFLSIFFRKVKPIIHAMLLSFAAGVMFFSVLGMLESSYASAGLGIVLLGIAGGFLLLRIMEKTIPHVHMLVRKKEIESSKKKAALLIGAITLHNIPEGFSIAAAFADSIPLGWLVTISMALQDIPEGLLIAAPLACYGVKMRKCIGFGVFSGLVEFGAAILGYFFFSMFTDLVPFGLAFAAGAMLYVIFWEILMDVFKSGFEKGSALSFVAGIVVAYGLASLIGLSF
ncbi:MAG: ZIP family metal transporter [bacterium]|nr:ZIP family metal transporter [bacterium]